MKTSGLKVCDSNGYHPDDDWCSPRVQFRVESTCQATELRLGVWLPPDDEPFGTLMTVTHHEARPQTRAVPFGEQSEIAVHVHLAPGEELSFQVDCEHLVKNKGEDARMLSFVMTSLVAL